jgi:DNA-binding transcriptional LysR family regulator
VRLQSQSWSSATSICNRRRSLSFPWGIRATLDGWGLARVLSYQIGEHLVAGRLQNVLAEFEQEPLPIHIVHPEGRRAPAKVRAFVDLAAERLRANRLIN